MRLLVKKPQQPLVHIAKHWSVNLPLLYKGLQYLVFPAIAVGALLATIELQRLGWSMIVAVYSAIALSALLITVLERVMPYRRDWTQSDQDVGTDLTHGVVSYVLIPLVQKPLMLAGLFWLTAALSDLSQEYLMISELWPSQWPLWLQLILALLVSDAGRYWGHRLAHEVPWLWRFHEVHHSPNRLYWLNAVRQHPVDRAWFYVTEWLGLILLGAPASVIALYLVFNAVHGFFQHTNIDIKLGPLNWLVNVADLHRWHHSKKVAESNANYGNNLIVFDVLFGTRKLPKGDVESIGVMDASYPKGYWQQLWRPFAKRSDESH